MKKTLQLLLLMGLAAGSAQAQFSPYNRVINVDWNRGASPANDTTAAGIASPGLYESPNNNDNKRFFPFPSKGDYRLRALCYGTDAEFNLSGSILSIKNSTTKLAKVAAFKIENASSIAKFSFNLDLTNYTGAGAFSIGFGNSDNGNTLTSSSSPFTNTAVEVFGSFRIVKSGNLVTQYKDASGGTQTNATPYLIKAGQSQLVEIYLNSTAAAITYTYGTTPVTLPANSYNIYVDGAAQSDGTDNNFPGSSAYTAAPINAISFAYSNVATQETVKLSNLRVTYQSATLPVSLTSFTGKKENEGIRLNWSTASELNNNHFELLRSANGQDFASITSIAGNGTSNQANTYSYLDRASEAGTNYYKLKQVDKDGKATVHNQVVAVNSDLTKSQAFSVFLGNSSLSAKFEVARQGNASINLTDLSGKLVFSSNVNASKGLNNVSLQMPALNPGLYIVTLTQGGKSQSVKVVKQ